MHACEHRTAPLSVIQTEWDLLFFLLCLMKSHHQSGSDICRYILSYNIMHVHKRTNVLGWYAIIRERRRIRQRQRHTENAQRAQAHVHRVLESECLRACLRCIKMRYDTVARRARRTCVHGRTWCWWRSRQQSAAISLQPAIELGLDSLPYRMMSVALCIYVLMCTYVCILFAAQEGDGNRATERARQPETGLTRTSSSVRRAEHAERYERRMWGLMRSIGNDGPGGHMVGRSCLSTRWF